MYSKDQIREMCYINELDESDEMEQEMDSCSLWLSHVISRFCGMDLDVMKRKIYDRMYLAPIIWSIFMYILDMGVDIFLIVNYFLNNKIFYGAITLTLVIIPYFVNVILSVNMYREFQNSEEKIYTPKNIFLASFLSPLWRYIQALKLAREKKAAKENSASSREIFILKKRLELEKFPANFMSIVECFLEAVPQLVLQTYILFVEGPSNKITGFIPVLIKIISIWSIAWSVQSFKHFYYKKIQFRNTWTNTAWHRTNMVVRILGIAWMLEIAPSWVTMAILIIHWLGMTCCLMKLNKDPLDMSHVNLEDIKYLIYGFIYIFTIIPTLRQIYVPTSQYKIFYSVFAAEFIVCAFTVTYSSTDYFHNKNYGRMISIISWLVIGMAMLFRVSVLFKCEDPIRRFLTPEQVNEQLTENNNQHELLSVIYARIGTEPEQLIPEEVTENFGNSTSEVQSNAESNSMMMSIY